MSDQNPRQFAESVAEPPPAPLVADPALIIDRAHYDDLLRVRLWRWLKRQIDGYRGDIATEGDAP